jgi:ethanolamine utilization cobalamin adenosyltransferase
MGKKVLSLNDLKKALSEGKNEICIGKNTILTPSAKDFVLTGAVNVIETDCDKKVSEKDDIPKDRLKFLIKTISKRKDINISDDDLDIVVEKVLQQLG